MKLIVPKKKAQNEKKTQNQLTEAKAQSWIQKGSKRPDFLSNVLKHDGTEKGMTVDELVSNSYVLIIAGSETTATLLSGVTYYILTVPGVLDKLKAETRKALGQPSISSNTHCPFLMKGCVCTLLFRLDFLV